MFDPNLTDTGAFSEYGVPICGIKNVPMRQMMIEARYFPVKECYTPDNAIVTYQSFENGRTVIAEYAPGKFLPVLRLVKLHISRPETDIGNGKKAYEKLIIPNSARDWGIAEIISDLLGEKIGTKNSSAQAS